MNRLIQVRILQKQHFYLILLLVENMSHRKYVPFYLLVEKVSTLFIGRKSVRRKYVRQKNVLVPFCVYLLVLQ